MWCNFEGLIPRGRWLNFGSPPPSTICQQVCQIGIFTKLSVHVGDRNPKFSTLYMAVSQCLGLSRRLAIFATVAAASALSRGERPIRSA
jgi:hypothetical protein